MSNGESSDTAKVFMSGKSQAVRLPKKFRFTEGCDEVSIRQVGRHLILSPRIGTAIAFGDEQHPRIFTRARSGYRHVDGSGVTPPAWLGLLKV